MHDQFERLIPLYGIESLQKIQNATVAVIGLGGVGASAVEALARMGVGRLIIVDKDKVVSSNINRLITATHDTIGLEKSTLMKNRIKSINPQCEVIDFADCFDESLIKPIFDYSIDFVFDAIDSLQNKALIVKTCKAHKIPFIVSTGQGNRVDSSKIKICDLFETSYDPLARKLRAILRKDAITSDVPVVFSSEHPLRDSTLSFIASNPFGPATAGIRAAEYITKKLME